MPNVWADELREFLRANEARIAAGEAALGTTFRHVMGRQPNPSAEQVSRLAAEVLHAAPAPQG